MASWRWKLLWSASICSWCHMDTSFRNRANRSWSGSHCLQPTHILKRHGPTVDDRLWCRSSACPKPINLMTKWVQSRRAWRGLNINRGASHGSPVAQTSTTVTHWWRPMQLPRMPSLCPAVWASFERARQQHTRTINRARGSSALPIAKVKQLDAITLELHLLTVYAVSKS